MIGHSFECRWFFSKDQKSVTVVRTCTTRVRRIGRRGSVEFESGAAIKYNIIVASADVSNPVDRNYTSAREGETF
jgi:hypothetical protein